MQYILLLYLGCDKSKPFLIVVLQRAMGIPVWPTHRVRVMLIRNVNKRSRAAVGAHFTHVLLLYVYLKSGFRSKRRPSVNV